MEFGKNIIANPSFQWVHSEELPEILPVPLKSQNLFQLGNQYKKNKMYLYILYYFFQPSGL